MSIWQDALIPFEDKSTFYGARFWGGFYTGGTMAGYGHAMSKIAYTAEAWRYLTSCNLYLNTRRVSDMKTAEKVEFRGLTIYVLDYCALIPMKQICDQNLIPVKTTRSITSFHGSRLSYYRVPLEVDEPFVLNKENILNHALLYAATFAAAIAGRKRREVDIEGLERPPALTDVYRTVDISTCTEPKPELILYAPQT